MPVGALLPGGSIAWRLRGLIVGVLAAGPGAAGAAPAQAPPTLLIRHAKVVPMTDAGRIVLEDHAVLIRGDTIVWVGPDAARPRDGTAVEEDAQGRFLLPGLIDLHVHLSEAHLPLFLANGVTAVREMNGSAAHLRMRDEIAAGERRGPRMSVASPLLTDQDWSVRHVRVPHADSARALVDRLAEAGYEWLKIYDGLSAEVYAALVEGAREHGLPLTGHIPESVGLAGVLDAGQDLEHVEKIAWVTVGMDPDPARIPDVVEAVSAAGVRLTATLWSQRILMAQGSVEYDSLFARPESRFVSDGTRGWWSSLRRDPPRRQDPDGRAARLHAWQRALVRALHEAGVPILVGTDTPNPLLVPGFSMHDEIAALVGAGIPVGDVLRAATAVAGDVLGGKGTLGVVRAGARADLLLVADDPLETPGVLRTPDAVISRGRLLRRADLDAMLDAAEAAASGS